MTAPAFDIDWPKTEAVIFDCDGTLYDQRALRLIMLREMAAHYLFRPHRWREVQAIRCFRKKREELALSGCQAGIEAEQYRATAEACGFDEPGLRRLVQTWMFERATPHLARVRWPGLKSFLEALHRRSILTAVFSDYPAEEKLSAMDLPPLPCLCSTDPSVDRLKPDPRGLEVLVSRLGVEPARCLFIGDRRDRDGECAHRLGMPVHIIERTGARAIYEALLRDLEQARPDG